MSTLINRKHFFPLPLLCFFSGLISQFLLLLLLAKFLSLPVVENPRIFRVRIRTAPTKIPAIDLPKKKQELPEPVQSQPIAVPESIEVFKKDEKPPTLIKKIESTLVKPLTRPPRNKSTPKLPVKAALIKAKNEQMKKVVLKESEKAEKPATNFPSNLVESGAEIKSSPAENDFAKPGEAKPDENLIFLEQVRKTLLKSQVFPASARRRNITGVVLLQFQLDQNGRVIKTSSSGNAHSTLKKAAIDLLKSVRFPIPPTGWQSSYKIEIPVKYSLK
ncbi:MAG: TonB family protein [Candidatus Riflebacteria bacterium]